MKRENYAKEKALLNAEKINSVRKNHEGSVDLISNWTSLFRDAGVQYIYKMASELRKLGYLKNAVDSEYGYELSFFEFTDKPIYYKDLIPIFREIYDYNQKKSPNAKSKSERPKTFSIANHGVSIFSASQEDRFKDFTDAELVQELRDRGFTVTAEKVTTIKL